MSRRGKAQPAPARARHGTTPPGLLSLEKVRDILGPAAPEAQSDLVAARDQAYELAKLLFPILLRKRR